MPMYYLRCPEGHVSRVLRDRPPGTERCRQPGCEKEAVRAPQGASARVVEVLDNGAMRKALERPADAERLRNERIRAYEAEEEG